MSCRLVKVDKTDKTETSLEGKEKPVRFVQLKYKCSPYLNQLREEDESDRQATDEPDTIMFVDGNTGENEEMTMKDVAEQFARFFPKMKSRKEDHIQEDTETTI